MKILVQKFGGTSMATRESRQYAIHHIKEAKENGYSVVVVVSAMGRKGAPYATDTLLEMGLQACPGLPSREKDLLLSCGETIAAALMAGELHAAGLSAQALTGGQAGILTDSRFGSADCIHADTGRLTRLLQEGTIPVVAGFQGVSTAGDVTTLGRGASDYTAALLGTALEAESIEIYTDVEGIMTADPRLVPEARVLPSISYTEVFQLADQGAKVIHPRAVEAAMRGNVPMTIRPTLTDAPGTRIGGNTFPADSKDNRIITSITLMDGRSQITCTTQDSDKIEQLLAKLAEEHISIDLINIFPEKVVFTIQVSDIPSAKALAEAMHLAPEIREACTKVSCIGHRMRGVPGVMAKLVTALHRAGIPLLQTADSHMTLCCLVPAEDGNRAVEVLHKAFSLS